MTYTDILIQVLIEATGESEKTVAEFIEHLKKREPKEQLEREIPPHETSACREALRKEYAIGSNAKLIRETVAAFRSRSR